MNDGQKRKTGNVPYIAHPVAVAMILQDMGCNEMIVAAAAAPERVIAELEAREGPAAPGICVHRSLRIDQNTIVTEVFDERANAFELTRTIPSAVDEITCPD